MTRLITAQFLALHEYIFWPSNGKMGMRLNAPRNRLTLAPVWASPTAPGRAAPRARKLAASRRLVSGPARAIFPFFSCVRCGP